MMSLPMFFPFLVENRESLMKHLAAHQIPPRFTGLFLLL